MADARSDEELMTAVARGNLDAFSTLVDRHHQRVLNTAYGMSGDAEASRDIAQDAFMRILKHAAMYTPRAKFTTFLYTVVRSVVVETGRRTARRREVALNSAQMPAAPESADAGAERGELRQRLTDALAELPDELRDAFVLSEIEGLRYRDIAEICGCPEGTVASRKHQAIQRLRKSLGAFQGDGE
jgi:RNA polymerase sigma-70 factor (ECF subfamily)